MQEILAVSEDRLDLINLRTKSTASSHHDCNTKGVQLLPTPDAAMLLVLRYTEEGWAMQVLSLDEVMEPPVFKIIKEKMPLPLLTDMPEVSIHCTI